MRREEAVRALGELRELVRGIGPSILRPRPGGGDRIPLAAGACAQPDARVDAGEPRPPATVEAAAYFVVAEAIANAAKHSGATTVRVWRDAADRIVVEQLGRRARRRRSRREGGLTGLIQRCSRADGTLSVTSPPGGLTIAQAEIPCRCNAEDLLLRDGLTRLLRDSGCEVVAAVENGDDLVAAVERERPTWRSSTSACPRRSPTRACALRSARGRPCPAPPC